MAKQSRRDFLVNIGVAATGVAASGTLLGCSHDEKCSCQGVGSPPAGGAVGSCPSPVSSSGGAPPIPGGSATTGGAGPGVGGAGGATTQQLTGGIATGGSAGTLTTVQAGGAEVGGDASCPAPTECPPEVECPTPTECPPEVECPPERECPALAECPTPATLPTDWAKEADIVVLGTGFAGLAAAVSARDAGAEVLVLEKMPEAEEGGNSIISGNMWWTPTSVEGGVTYITALCMGLTDDLYIRALAEGMFALNDWLGTLGITATGIGIFQPEYPELPGSDAVRTWRNGAGSLWQPLRDAVASRRVEVLYATPVTDLIQDPSTLEVKGVIARSGNQTMNIKARRAVILACGGFEFDHALQAQHLPAWPVYSQGTPGNTGDGIRMAQKVGAALWHMNNALAHVGCFVPDPTDPSSIPIPLSLSNGCILVDRFGSRFMNEKREERHGFGHKEYLFFFDGLKQAFSRIPCYGIFDDTTRRMGGLAGGLLGWYGKHGNHTWSVDNSAEISSGWIKQGQTWEALAAEIGADPDTLAATVARYNELCAAGQDQDFGRSGSTLEELTTAPFYAIPIHPLMYNTQGGPRRNERCQVVDPFGQPLPRLYSAGELGSGWGWMYNGGGNAAEAVVTGRLAGEGAAGEGPWA